jgi:putative Mn2+ efflux pump MntP
VATFEIVIVGLALSMDAFAVTISNTFAYPRASRARLLALPIAFGVFQGLMPLLGYFAGSFAAELIERFAGIVSLVILGFIGGKMVWDGVSALRATRAGALAGGAVGDAQGDTADGAAQTGRQKSAQLTFAVILMQAVATSIDAFIVGVSFLAQGANIAFAAPIVAATTFLCCLLALVLGKRFGVLLGDKAQIVGGVVLVLIGLKACFL